MHLFSYIHLKTQQGWPLIKLSQSTSSSWNGPQCFLMQNIDIFIKPKSLGWHLNGPNLKRSTSPTEGPVPAPWSHLSSSKVIWNLGVGGELWWVWMNLHPPIATVDTGASVRCAELSADKCSQHQSCPNPNFWWPFLATPSTHFKL